LILNGWATTFKCPQALRFAFNHARIALNSTLELDATAKVGMWECIIAAIITEDLMNGKDLWEMQIPKGLFMGCYILIVEREAQ
jgi:hypothetical protein